MQALLTESEERRYAELQQQALDFAREGDTESLRLMVLSGLPVNLSDAKGQSLLMLASYNGHRGTAAMLLEHGAEVDRRNDRGQTPLGGAAFKGFVDIACLLLDYGADINADNGGGMTPLSYASMFGRREMVAFLEASGARRRFRDRLMGMPSSLLAGMRSA